MVGLLPLSGVVSPFLSFGRSAMLANFLLFGICSRPVGPAAGRQAGGEGARFDGALRGPAVGPSALVGAGASLLRAGLGAAGAPEPGAHPRRPRRSRATACAASVQPAAGGHRRDHPARPIVDRNGLPLATSEPGRPAALPDGVPLALGGRRRSTAGRPRRAGERPGRLYPLGGHTFHLLGDLRSRVNWGASNTSFAERDFRIRLQGYDDYAAVVEVTQPPQGGAVTARQIRRDYSELLPLLRLPRRPEHRAVRSILERDRTLRTDVDARLQVRATEILRARERSPRPGTAAPRWCSTPAPASCWRASA